MTDGYKSRIEWSSVVNIILIFLVLVVGSGVLTHRVCTSSPPQRVDMENTFHLVVASPDELEEEMEKYMNRNCVFLETVVVEDQVVVLIKCREEGLWILIIGGGACASFGTVGLAGISGAAVVSPMCV